MYKLIFYLFSIFFVIINTSFSQVVYIDINKVLNESSAGKQAIKSLESEIKSKNVRIHRDIQERDSGKNVIILDPDDYMISLFEPNFSAEKNIQSGGYIGYTPA